MFAAAWQFLAESTVKCARKRRREPEESGAPGEKSALSAEEDDAMGGLGRRVRLANESARFQKLLVDGRCGEIVAWLNAWDGEVEKLDHSRAYYGNPLCAWARLHMPFADVRLTRRIFAYLMRTGASRFLNEADSGGSRPVDVACACLSFGALEVLDSPGVLDAGGRRVDWGPAKRYPLAILAQQAGSGGLKDAKQIVEWIKRLLLRADRADLDWCGKGATAFYWLTYARWPCVYSQLLPYFVLLPGVVNPCHPCFLRRPSVFVAFNRAGTRDGVLLAIAREAWVEFRRMHLPAALAASLDVFPPEVRDIVAEYVAYVAVAPPGGRALLPPPAPAAAARAPPPAVPAAAAARPAAVPCHASCGAVVIAE